MDCGAGGCRDSSLNAKSMRIDASCGNCTRSSLAAMRLRRCFSRRILRAPSGPTVVNFIFGCVASTRVGTWPTRAIADEVLTTTVAVAAATTATAAGFVLRFVYLERATAEVLAVE